VAIAVLNQHAPAAAVGAAAAAAAATAAAAVCVQGKQVLFMTNNSMKSRQAYLGKFKALGVPAAVVSVRA
jgi:ribonucleotide monophosphatase NagD (HAD superfamily)